MLNTTSIETQKHITSVDQSDRCVPYNLRQSGATPIEMLIFTRVRKSPFWHLSIEAGAWRATIYNRIYHPFGYVRPEAGVRGMIHDHTTMAVNVKSMFFCARAALSSLRDGGGVIVNHASNAGLQGFSGCVIYSASKGAVVNMTRALAMELAPDIRVNCVCPSTLDNEMGWSEFNRTDDPQSAYQACAEGAPMKRVGTSEDAAAAITFLASDDASFINGIAVPVDGGKAAGK